MQLPSCSLQSKQVACILSANNGQAQMVDFTASLHQAIDDSHIMNKKTGLISYQHCTISTISYRPYLCIDTSESAAYWITAQFKYSSLIIELFAFNIFARTVASSSINLDHHKGEHTKSRIEEVSKKIEVLLQLSGLQGQGRRVPSMFYDAQVSCRHKFSWTWPTERERLEDCNIIQCIDCCDV